MRTPEFRLTDVASVGMPRTAEGVRVEWGAGPPLNASIRRRIPGGPQFPLSRGGGFVSSAAEPFMGFRVPALAAGPLPSLPFL